MARGVLIIGFVVYSCNEAKTCKLYLHKNFALRHVLVACMCIFEYII